jgi:membrane associated rhomboid family serine protease
MGFMSFINNLKHRVELLNIAEKIILLNVIIFIIPFFIKTFFFLFNIESFDLIYWLKLSPDILTFIFTPWTIITYGFIHGSISHILWNMILLYFSSRFFLNLFSAEKFLNTYFLGIILGGIIFLFSFSVFPVFKNSYANLIGSSAGVMSVLIFVCTYSPDQEIRIIFFNLKLKYLGIALVLIDIIQIPSGNAGGNLAHLGGSLFGFIYANQLKNGNDIGLFFEKFLFSFYKFFKKPVKLKTVHKNKNPNQTSIDKQKRVDDILDKISNSGYDSLSKEEKDFLFKIAKDK